MFAKNCLFVLRLSFFLFTSLLPRRCSIQSLRRLRHVERPLLRGNVSDYYHNLGSLRDGNETWRKPPYSLLGSAVLLMQLEDSEFMTSKQCII